MVWLSEPTNTEHVHALCELRKIYRDMTQNKNAYNLQLLQILTIRYYFFSRIKKNICGFKYQS